MLINSQYFTGEVYIPNLTGSGVVVTGNIEELNRFITKYEKLYLLYLLGQDLYEAFLAGLATAQQEPPVPPAQKWIDLKAQLIDETAKLSPIVGYVYYHYSRHRLSTSAALGEVEQSAENATNVLNTDKMMRAYNESVRDGRNVYDWLVKHAATYPDFDINHPYPLSVINIYGI